MKIRIHFLMVRSHMFIKRSRDFGQSLVAFGLISL